jgi:hypothetical protein
VTIVSLKNDAGVYRNVTVASVGLDAAREAKRQLVALHGDKSWRILKYRSAS